MDPSNQTPPPSRPTPSGRPTLLTPGTPGATDADSPTRMLASLERDAKARGGGSTSGRRFGKAQGIALLAVALLAGAGAFFAWVPGDDASVRSAAASSTRGVATAQPGVVASAASGIAAPEAMAGAVAVAAAASAPAPATAQIEPATAAALPSSAPVVAAAMTSAGAAGASAPTGNALPALARSGADSPLESKTSASAPVSRGKKAPPKESGGKSLAAGVAATKGGPARPEAAPIRPARKDDEDADTALVAAMIARLDRRGATPNSPATAAVRKDDHPALVESLRQCDSKTDPLDARRCRNRACETHWGKADACPAARAPKGSLGAGVERGKPA